MPLNFKSNVIKFVRYSLIISATAIYLVPILYMLLGSFKPDDHVLSGIFNKLQYVAEHYSLQNFRDVFERVDFKRYLANSLIITGCVVFFGLVVNAMAGYALARFHWQGRKLTLTIILAIMIIPMEATAVPLFYQLSILGLRNTYVVQIIPFIANAFFIVLFYTYFLSLPKELKEAAYMDGASPWRTFLFIVLPNSKPVLASVAILSFLLQWGNYLWPLLMVSDENVRPLSLAISTFYTLPPLQWGDLFAFGVLMVLPVLIVFIVFQKWFVQGVVASSHKA